MNEIRQLILGGLLLVTLAYARSAPLTSLFKGESGALDTSGDLEARGQFFPSSPITGGHHLRVVVLQKPLTHSLDLLL